MRQFRPGGPLYEDDEIGWVFRKGRQLVCYARDVRVGDLLPNCDLRDELDDSIYVLVQVRQIVEVASTLP